MRSQITDGTRFVAFFGKAFFSYFFGGATTSGTKFTDSYLRQRFTERTRQGISFAQAEAAGLGETRVSTAHLLLGLLRVEDTAALTLLSSLNVSLETIRNDTKRFVIQGEGRPGQDRQMTPRAKRIIYLAHDEAGRMKQNYIGSEHLLLGLIREGEGLAGRVQDIMAVARMKMKEYGHEELDTRHIPLGIILEPEGIGGNVLRDAGLTVTTLEAAILSPDAAAMDASSGESRSSNRYAAMDRPLWKRFLRV